MKSFFLVFSSFGDETTTLCRNIGHLSPSDAETTILCRNVGTSRPVTRGHHFIETSGTCRPVTRRPLCVETSGTCRPVTRRQPLCRNIGHLSPSDTETTTLSKFRVPVVQWLGDHHSVETSGTCCPVTQRQPLCRNFGHLSPSDAETSTFVETSDTCPVTRRNVPADRRRNCVSAKA